MGAWQGSRGNAAVANADDRGTRSDRGGVAAMEINVSTNDTTARWDRHFLRLALANCEMSKDPRTQVGSVIVGPDREIRSMGYNGLPRGIADSRERLHDRDLKLRLVVHGEMNAILNAARI